MNKKTTQGQQYMPVKHVRAGRNEKACGHRDYCIAMHLPYIEVLDAGGCYDLIFYDLTSFDVDLNAISSAVRDFYRAYSVFFCLPAQDFGVYLDNPGRFQLQVLKAHSACLADALCDYLQQRWLPQAEPVR